ncbi:MAG: G8 domain-containing protein [Meiothermus sp.]|nr:G8 domain-containing protein [Meiothermus sp.]
MILPVLLLALVACGGPDSSSAPAPTSPGTAPADPSPGLPPSVPVERFGLWSSPQTWPLGQVPRAGEAVTIPVGLAVTLDVSPPPLKGLTVNGHLVFDREKDLRLSSDWIMVHGRLEVGTPERPYLRRAEIVLTGDDPNQDVMGMSTKAIGVMGGGALELHGEPRLGWTRLAATAPRGATQITVQDSSGWRVGDQIVVSATDYDARQSEPRSLTAVSGNTLTLDRPLAYLHYGQETFGVDQRGEVGLLSRNILIRGETTLEQGFGGHLMVMRGGWARLSGVELRRMGQKGRMGRYPVHWHLVGEVAGQYLRQSSIHQSFNRCVTLHGTSRAEVTGNVAYDALGHCYFLEDGSEIGNRLEGNLGLLTRPPAGGEEIIPSDSLASTFWITNPDNVVRGNVAGGSRSGFGFWYALPQNPIGASRSATNDASVFPRRTPLGEFSGNVAHSNGAAGLMVGMGIDAQGLTQAMRYTPRTNPADPASSPVVAEFRNLTAYKNRGQGAWLGGDSQRLTGARLADNAVGVSLAYNALSVEDALIVGDSDNLGQPEVGSGEITGPGGRTLPRPFSAETARFPVRGLEYYGGPAGFRNVRFVNFQPNSVRPASALSYQNFTSYPTDARNYAEAAQLVNAQPVYFAPRLEPTPAQVARDDNADAYRSAAILDRDGSLTGRAGQTVVYDDPFLADAFCTPQPAWNAQVCPHRYARFLLRNLSRQGEIAPLTLTREEGTRPSFRMWGSPEGGSNSEFSSSLILGRSYSLRFAGAAPSNFRVFLLNAATGSIALSLAYPSAPHVYGPGVTDAHKLASMPSIAALNASSQSAYFFDGSIVHVRLVIPAGADIVGMNVCRNNLCR